MFHNGDTKFSYNNCQWAEAEAIKIGKQIHQKYVDMVKNAEGKFFHKGEKVLTYF